MQYFFAHGDYSTILDTIASICFLLMNSLLIISGVILVTTVFAIRQFYKQRNAIDVLDTGVLVRHASAFALFLIAVLIYSIAFAIADMMPTKLTIEIYYYSFVFYAITDFISQVLLCTICGVSAQTSIVNRP
jgi:hypothetical protein